MGLFLVRFVDLFFSRFGWSWCILIERESERERYIYPSSETDR